MQTVSLMDANQNFSKLIKKVERGEKFVITRRGLPVADLTPHKLDKTVDADWVSAFERMKARMDEGASLAGLRVKRDELYDH